MKNTGTILAIILVVVLAVLLLGGIGMMGFGGFGMMGPGMMRGYGGYGGMMGGWGYNPIGAILSLVVSALIISGIVLLVAWLIRNAHASTSTERGGLSIGSNETPLDILKTRYARGEITKEQFEQMKHDLSA